jgi:DNA-binding response OmpR family regulator
MYRVLIIEDDPSIQKMLRSFFLAHGAEVLTAEDGRLGLTMINSVNPDVVILDVVLPYIDGFSIVDKLRKDANEVPVILLTEKNTVEEKVEGLGLGADDYVTKPFSTKELLARVKCQLRRRGKSTFEKTTPPVMAGSITIYPKTREVSCNSNKEELLPLTKTEFDLLYYLAQRQTQVCSHGELLQDVMGYNTDIKTKSLVIHIANIRRKLSDNNIDDVQIKAVTGVGYRLIAPTGNSVE